uniref:Uncharacterized protein n=1 Tax=Panagrellus redivivus TaxID=6233 RepID=A0A7E4V5Y1_PANRE
MCTHRRSQGWYTKEGCGKAVLVDQFACRPRLKTRQLTSNHGLIKDVSSEWRFLFVANTTVTLHSLFGFPFKAPCRLQSSSMQVEREIC